MPFLFISVLLFAFLRQIVVEFELVLLCLVALAFVGLFFLSRVRLFILLFLLVAGVFMSFHGRARFVGDYAGMTLWVEGRLFSQSRSKRGMQLILRVRRILLIGGRECSVSGRVIVYVRNKLKYKLESDLRVVGELRSISVRKKVVTGVGVLYSPQSIIVLRPPSSLSGVISALRQIFISSCRKLAGDGGPLLVSLLFGRSGNLSKQKSRVFARAGMLHLLAVSGMHVAMLCACCFFLFKIMPFSQRTVIPIILFLLIVYCFLCRFSPSVVRASLMVFYYMVARLLWRSSFPWHGLCFAGSVQLLLDPDLLFSASFLLSFAAVVAIFLLYRPFYRLFRICRLPKYIAVSFALSFSVQLFLAPLLLFLFRECALLAPFATLLSIPIVFLLFLLALVSPLIVCVGFDFLFMHVASTLLRLLSSVAQWASGYSFSVLKVDPFPLSFLILYYLLLIMIVKGWALFGKYTGYSRASLTSKIAAIFTR